MIRLLCSTEYLTSQSVCTSLASAVVGALAQWRTEPAVEVEVHSLLSLTRSHRCTCTCIYMCTKIYCPACSLFALFHFSTYSVVLYARDVHMHDGRAPYIVHVLQENLMYTYPSNHSDCLSFLSTGQSYTYHFYPLSLCPLLLPSHPSPLFPLPFSFSNFFSALSPPSGIGLYPQAECEF